MFRQPIRAHDIGEANIGRTGVTVFGPLVPHCCRIALLVWIKWIANWRLQSFVVRWQRTVGQSLRRENPASPIRVQDKRFISGESLITLRVFRRLIIRRFRPREVRDVQPGPLFVLLIPPNEFLALAPRLPIRTGRGAVIEDAAVRRPGKAPAMSPEVLGIPLVSAVLTRAREDAGVDPA